MSVAVRRGVFLAAGLVVGLFLLWGMRGLPSFGHYRGPYGNVLNKVAVPQRHATNVVAAVNFDYRGLDTIGEEYILFVSVAGITMLLRTERSETEVEPPADDEVDHGDTTSEAVRALCLPLAAPVVLLGLYIVSHGALTPGGGFQGGVILAAGVALIFVAGEYGTLRALSPPQAMEAADAFGAGGFVVIGVAGVAAGVAFLQNIVPLGPIAVIYAGGTIPYINLSIGLEVMGGFLMIFSELLKQVTIVRAQGEQAEQGPQREQAKGREQPETEPEAEPEAEREAEPETERGQDRERRPEEPRPESEQDKR